MRERIGFEKELGILLPAAGARVFDRELPEAAKCREDWEKLFNSLPADVKKSLGEKDWSNAVILAIHHGIRDLGKLTRILFFAKYGAERGFCNLKDTAADAKYRKFWNQEKSGVRGLMARPSPPLAQKGGIVCQKVERILSDPRPDNPKVDITGRYENQFKSGNRTLTDWTIAVNQAGKHIEGIITKVLCPDPRPKGWLFRQEDDPKDRSFTEFYGDLQSDGSYLFFDKRNPLGNWGYFRFENNRLSWELNGKGKSQLTKVSKNATLMNTSSFDKLVWLHEKFPLTRMQLRHLWTNLAEQKLAPYLEKYFSTPAGITTLDKKKLIEQAGKFDNFIGDIFTYEFGGIHEQDLELGRFYAKAVMSGNKWKFKQITRSQLDWIQIMLDVNTNNWFSLPAIEKYLGLKPSKNNADPQTPPHEYKITLKLTGASVIVGGYFGKITVEKLNGKTWKETYRVHLLGGGIDVSFRDEMIGKASTYHEWLPPDIPGEIRLGEIGITFGVGLPVGGVSAAAGFMQIFGSGYLPPMDVGYTDVDAKVLKPKVPKAGGKALPFGKIWKKDFKDFDATKSIAITDYAGAYNLKDDTHFCLGSAVLTEDARQALRIACANELVAFSSPTTTLSIIGHTDRVDTSERNLTLSALRAENTLQAIKDILGANYKIPDSNIKELSGKGENEAIKDNRPDNKPEPKYRRVDVFLDTRLIISLKAL